MNPGNTTQHQNIKVENSPARQHNEGKLADNIVHFVRTLRKTGLRLGPSVSLEAIRAVECGGVANRDDFYWTLHSVIINKHDDSAVFEEAFNLFWRSRDLVEKMLQMFSPVANPDPNRQKPKPAQNRVAQALFGQQESKAPQDKPEVEIDAQFTASQREKLKQQDFAQMSADELVQAEREIAAMVPKLQRYPSRRFETATRPGKINMRKTLNQGMRTGGSLIIPQFKTKKLQLPPLVVLADISGSMSAYSRIFLHFLYSLESALPKTHCFVFGTRLTNISRQLRNKDIDLALDRCGQTVKDWSGGTQIASCLADFNKFWSRRVLGQGAITLLISDGLERDNFDQLAKETDRLHRSTRKLIWLNPLLRYDRFEAKARGIKIMLDHVDEFRPVHSLQSIAQLCEALGGRAHV